MLPLFLPILISFQAPAAQPTQKAEPPKAQSLKPLGFFSQKFPYEWDTRLPLKAEVDGFKLNTIFFNRREINSGLLKGAEFGTRAQIEVTNTGKLTRMPNFAVAVMDDAGRLLGVATGGSRFLCFPQIQPKSRLGVFPRKPGHYKAPGRSLCSSLSS